MTRLSEFVQKKRDSVYLERSKRANNYIASDMSRSVEKEKGRSKENVLK